MRLPPCPVIDSLTERDRDLVLERTVPRALGRGDRLYLAGDHEPRNHFLLDGVMKLTARSYEGDESILLLAVPGELLGEVAALDDLGQPLDAVAATDCDLLGVARDLLLDVLERNPTAALAVAAQLAQRVRWMCDTAIERSSSEVPARLAGRLLDLADLLGRMESGAVEVDLPLPQHELASLAGMCRESACKTLRRFKDEGLLDYRGRRLRILRPDLLERIRCAGRH